MIRAVTFDLWNTLLCERFYSDYRIGLLVHALDEEGFPRDRHRVEVEYSSTIDFFYEVWMKERRHIPATKLMKFILNRLDVHLPAEIKNRLVKNFEEAILKDPPPLVRDARKVLESLHGLYIIGLVSNSGVTPGRVLRQVLDDQKVLQYFSCTMFSDEVGYHKPHPTIFRKAIKELNVKANDTIHIGDLLEPDVAGAKAVGMKTVWFNATERNNQTHESEFAPDHEIRALSQLPGILERKK
ncbi:MAG: HAD family hydrolase [Candidatus Bathyarchaeota archaeon]|nr:MAG: HAD family hydrolase [Candidatus Bathyarchaeota archaeon]